MIWFIAGLIVAANIYLYYRNRQTYRMFIEMIDRVQNYCSGLISNSTYEDMVSGITSRAIDASFEELHSVHYMKVVFNYRRVRPENFWSEDFLEAIK